MFTEVIGILLATTMTVGYFYPELLMNVLLSMVKDKKTGAFDFIVEGVKIVVKSLTVITIDLIHWKNPPLCYSSPYFVRISGLLVEMDPRTVFQAMVVDRSLNNVMVIHNVEIDHADVYIVNKADDGDAGATLNMWACMGSHDDEEATQLLTAIQQSISKVLDQLSSTNLDTSLSCGSTNEDKEKCMTSKLNRFALKRLTLHAPALVGQTTTTASPMILTTPIELTTELLPISGISMNDLMFHIVGHIVQRIVAKYPMLTMRMMIRGVMSLGRGSNSPPVSRLIIYTLCLYPCYPSPCRHTFYCTTHTHSLSTFVLRDN